MVLKSTNGQKKNPQPSTARPSTPQTPTSHAQPGLLKPIPTHHIGTNGLIPPGSAGAVTPGQVGQLLRREGLYSSHLTSWRKQRREGSLRGLSPRKRGRKPQPKNPLTNRVAELERQNRALQERLRQAEVIIGVQKKMSELLGIPLGNSEDTERSS